MNSQDTNLAQSRKALFLDRDGVLIEYIPYLSHPHQVALPLGAAETFKQWQDAGYLLIVITNQSGIARGYFTANDVDAVHTKMRQAYASFGVYFQDIFICSHQPSDNCGCRKPSPYMLKEAAKKYSLNLRECFFIGDAVSDMECAVNAGCNPIFLLTNRTLAEASTLAQKHSALRMINQLSETINFIEDRYILKQL
ncbi:HAD-IIIA family hydrolase [Nostoc sp. FACHB-110]|uniref:D-glycero-alpha-D-manno-heptose-1,7-bisphosphate 7-phosphatase n=1 Tax=Nostoc sp. FACHB-110 TaxID=2692834 RepID=UPI0018F0535A|nr:HAD family hydrolase [Nostoc sp. FACHB-110]